MWYKVAEHPFCISAEEKTFTLMQNYAPFSTTAKENVTFSLHIVKGEITSFIVDTHQDDGEGQVIISGHNEHDAPVFQFCWLQHTTGWLLCNKDYHEAQLYLTGCSPKLALDNALMILFALATADKQTVLFHAAAVSYQNQAYLFLGDSGMGKSTHAALWLKHIWGTELMNDDNPVVRINAEGQAVVYGSPWSGKTPCYRNVSLPLGGIVLLSQAPCNKIERLSNLDAYAALVPSISGKRWDRQIADGLHLSENHLVSHTPFWHLACLPDEAAARLCSKTIAP